MILIHGRIFIFQYIQSKEKETDTIEDTMFENSSIKLKSYIINDIYLRVTT